MASAVHHIPYLLSSRDVTTTRSPASRNRRASARPRPLVLPVTSTLYCRLSPSPGSDATALVTARKWRRERVVRPRVIGAPAREAPAASAMGAILYEPGWRGGNVGTTTASSGYIRASNKKSKRGSSLVENQF